MQINEVLEKITDRNAPVIGCIARAQGNLHHNLDAFGLDCDQIADSVEELLALTEYLDQETGEVDTVYTEFDGHCIIGKRVDESLLVAVTEHMQRAGFKKLQVGLSLQTRMLTKALEEAPAPARAPAPAPAPAPAAAPAPAPAAAPAEPMSAHAAIAANMERPAIPDPTAAPRPSAPEAAASEDPSKKGKVRKVYRGTVYWE